MRIVETAWLAQPHPDLADAYAHVKLGDSARQRLVRVRDACRQGARPYRGRAGDCARRDRRVRIHHGPRGAGAVHRSADAAGRDADGGARAYRARRFRPGAGVDAARGARAARSGLDGGRLCQRSLAAGLAGHPGGWTPSSGRRRSQHFRPTRAPRSNPPRSRKPCWRPRTRRRARAAGAGRG